MATNIFVPWMFCWHVERHWEEDILQKKKLPEQLHFGPIKWRATAAWDLLRMRKLARLAKCHKLHVEAPFPFFLRNTASISTKRVKNAEVSKGEQRERKYQIVHRTIVPCSTELPCMMIPRKGRKSPEYLKNTGDTYQIIDTAAMVAFQRSAQKIPLLASLATRSY